MKLTYVLGLTLLSASLMACGGRKNETNHNEDQPLDSNSTNDTNTPQEATTSQVLEDSESTDISAQTEEAFSSISNDLGLDSGLGLMLSAALQSETSSERNCEAATEVGAPTTVNISREHKKTFAKSNGEAGESTIGMNMTRTWTKNEGIIPCNESGTHISLALADFNGVTLETELFNKGFSRTLSKENSEGDLVNYVHSRNTSGKRNITWNSVTDEEGIITHKKSVTMDLSTVVKKPQKDNDESTEVNFSIKTGDAEAGEPLEVSASFDINNHWLSKTIESGTTVGTSPNKTITPSFDNVKFERNFDCDPVSGVITGSIASEKDGEPVTQEFVLNYTDNSFTLNGDTFERPDTELCEFAASNRTIKKVAKAKQQIRRAAIAYYSGQ